MTTRPSAGLRMRLLALVALAIVPAIGLWVYHFPEHLKQAREEAKTDARRIARAIARGPQSILPAPHQFLADIARIPEVENPPPDGACDRLLSLQLSGHRMLLALGVANPDGSVRCASMPRNSRFDVADRGWFRRALETRRFAIGDFESRERSLVGKETVGFAYPVIDGAGEVRTVAFLLLDLDWLRQLLQDAQLPEGAIVTALDGTGTILARHPDAERLVGQTIPELPLYRSILAGDAETVVDERWLDGVQRVSAYVRLFSAAEGAVFIRIGTPAEHFYAGVERRRIVELAVLASCALVILVAAWTGSEWLVLRRVRKLTEFATRLRDGDLGARVGLKSTRDEIGFLGRTFDDMAASLQARTEETRRANRALHALSGGNQALVRATDEQDLLQEVCRVAVTRGGYRFAWVGFAEHDPEKSIRPAAQFGHEEGYLGLLGRSWDDTDGGQGMAGTSIRTGKPCVVADIATDPRFEMHRDEALRRGFASAIALPLRIEGETIGVFALYGESAGEFDLAELELLGEMAEDLAFGIASLRLKDVARKKEEELKTTRQRLFLHVQQTPLAVIETDLERRVVEWNPAAEKMFGYTRAEALGQRAWFIVPEEGRAEVEAILADLRDSQEGKRKILRNLTKDGRAIDCEWYSNPLVDSDGQIIGFAAAAQDVTERIKSEKKIRQLAYFDWLTGLANRVQLEERMALAIADADRAHRPLALLTINVVRFRDLQDGLGFRAAEQLLARIAERLRGLAEGELLLARLGGDKFALLLPTSDAHDAAKAARDVSQTFQKSFMVEDFALDVQTSVGIAVYPGHGTDADALILRSDIAARQATAAGKECAIYSGATDRETPQRLVMIAELRRAIDSDQLRLHYQPKFDLRSGKVCGAEALVRWQHPQRGMVQPGQFINLAEYTGLIKPLTYWVIDAALRECRAVDEAGFDSPVAVNLSAHNLHDPELLERIRHMFATWGVPAARLEIEITESALMADPAASLKVLHGLREMGIKVAIDDFGTGYSSLGYLATLPAQKLKIDRSFVIGMVENPSHRTIVEATISLAHSLGLKVVAEGVETEEQEHALRGLACDEAQGYRYSQPLPADEFLQWRAKLGVDGSMTPVAQPGGAIMPGDPAQHA